MSKNWFPVIDEEKCIECGSCILRCKNEVYDQNEQPKPVVKNLINCCEGCHGCGSVCPVEAITYYGDE